MRGKCVWAGVAPSLGRTEALALLGAFPGAEMGGGWPEPPVGPLCKPLPSVPASVVCGESSGKHSLRVSMPQVQTWTILPHQMLVESDYVQKAVL